PSRGPPPRGAPRPTFTPAMRSLLDRRPLVDPFSDEIRFSPRERRPALRHLALARARVTGIHLPEEQARHRVARSDHRSLILAGVPSQPQCTVQARDRLPTGRKVEQPNGVALAGRVAGKATLFDHTIVDVAKGDVRRVVSRRVAGSETDLLLLCLLSTD